MTHRETEFLQFNTYYMSIHEHKGIDLFLVIFIEHISLRGTAMSSLTQVRVLFQLICCHYNQTNTQSVTETTQVNHHYSLHHMLYSIYQIIVRYSLKHCSLGAPS